MLIRASHDPVEFLPFPSRYSLTGRKTLEGVRSVERTPAACKTAVHSSFFQCLEAGCCHTTYLCDTHAAHVPPSLPPMYHSHAQRTLERQVARDWRPRGLLLRTLRVFMRSPDRFRPGQPLTLMLEISPSAGGPAPNSVRLYDRHVNQAERWTSADASRQKEYYVRTLPAEYTRSDYPQYYIQLEYGNDSAWLSPALNKTLSSQPYLRCTRETRDSENADLDLLSCTLSLPLGLDHYYLNCVRRNDVSLVPAISCGKAEAREPLVGVVELLSLLF